MTRSNMSTGEQQNDQGVEKKKYRIISIDLGTEGLQDTRRDVGQRVARVGVRTGRDCLVAIP